MLRAITRLNLELLHRSSPSCRRCAYRRNLSQYTVDRNLPGFFSARHRSTLVPQDQPEEPDADASESVTRPSASDAEYFRNVFQQQQPRKETKLDWNQFVDPDQYKKGVTQPAAQQSFGLLQRAAGQAPDTRAVASPDAQVVSSPVTGLADDLDTVDWEAVERHDPERRPLEPVPDQDPSLADAVPTLPAYGYNVAAFADKAPNVRRMLDLGVEVFQFDKDGAMSQMLVTGDWDTRIQPHIDWFHSLGVKEKNIGRVLSNWPRILKRSVADLQETAAYLASKKFPPEAVARILVKAPLAFSLSVRHVDKQLGALQRTFRLTGDEVRDVATRVPKVMIRPSYSFVVLRLALLHEMGFRPEEIKGMLLAQPKVFLLEKKEFLRRFDYLHNVCKFQHREMALFPGALRERVWQMKERHLFLKSLGRNQYDNKLPNYVSLHGLCAASDWEFCVFVAKQPLRVFNDFRKTL